MTATGDGPTPETWTTGRREAVAVAVLVGVDEDVAVGVDVDDAVGVSVVVLVDEAVEVAVLVLVDEGVWLAVAVGIGVTAVSRTVIVPVAPMTPLIAYG